MYVLAFAHSLFRSHYTLYSNCFNPNMSLFCLIWMLVSYMSPWGYLGVNNDMAKNGECFPCGIVFPFMFDLMDGIFAHVST